MKVRAYKLALSLAALIASAQFIFAQEFPKPSAELCQKYRQGPVVHGRIPIYYGKPSADPASFYWVDIWYDPEYLFDPLTDPYLDSFPGPDGLPNRDLSFHLEISTGQPLPREYKQSAKPAEDNFFTLLLRGGLSGVPASRVIATRANAKLNAKWRRTGEMFYGFERVEVFDRYDVETQVYIAPAPNNDLAVLSCNVPGIVPLPHCGITEKSQIFEMSYSGLRVNQLDELGDMRQHARDFTACLTWNGEK